jgi:NNP family nitrate/nitrite transporter-like MFS transporter
MGPRFSSALIMCIFAAPVFLFSLAHDAATFAAMRFLIGVCLASFVCCQQWVGSMFNVKIVGTANAIVAGWGNAGGGAAQIIMPAIYEGIRSSGVPAFEAWRWSFMVPGGFFLIMGLLTWATGWDTPRGDFRVLKENGEIATHKGSTLRLIMVGLLNYRTWVLMFNYGYSFGVELTIDNIIVTYLYDKYHMDLVTAGGLGALFGLMNVFSRPSGGFMSDLIAVPFGMRGRLWCLFILQFLGGVFCLALGCVHTLPSTLAVMIIFSIFCQQACGATYGVVPFVSRRAYGVVSGFVSSGGNLGAVITTVIFFGGSPSSPSFARDDDFIWMGVMIMCVTLTLALVHFPMWGSMFCKGDGTGEEDYYLNEWSAQEIAMGLHTTSMKFAMEARTQRSLVTRDRGNWQTGHTPHDQSYSNGGEHFKDTRRGSKDNRRGSLHRSQTGGSAEPAKNAAVIRRSSEHPGVHGSSQVSPPVVHISC